MVRRRRCEPKNYLKSLSFNFFALDSFDQINTVKLLSKISQDLDNPDDLREFVWLGVGTKKKMFG